MGVGHAERLEDVLLDVAVECGARQRLDDEPQHVIVGVRVVVSGAGIKQELLRGEGPDAALERARVLVIVGDGHRRETARVVQQLSDRDACGRGLVGHADPGHIALHRRVELDLACLHELHHRRRRKCLAQRREQERRVGGDRTAAAVGDAHRGGWTIRSPATITTARPGMSAVDARSRGRCRSS
jgi:hypothetical protein